MSRKLAVIGFVCTFGTALPAFSQEEEQHRQEAVVQAFGSFVSDSIQKSTKYTETQSGGVLASYRFYFTKNLGVEGNYGYTLNSQIYQGYYGNYGFKSHSNEITGAFVYRHALNERCSIFALAGTGALIFDPKDMPGLDHQTRPVFLYGGGFDFKINSRFFARAGYRGLVYNTPTFNVTGVERLDRVINRAEPTGGFGYRF